MQASFFFFFYHNRLYNNHITDVGAKLVAKIIEECPKLRVVKYVFFSCQMCFFSLMLFLLPYVVLGLNVVIFKSLG